MIRCILSVLVVAAVSTSARPADEGPHKVPEAAKVILDKAETFELISLDPVKPDKKPKEDFHGWKVLGKTRVADAAARKKLVAAFEKGVNEYKGGPAKCFMPRHGIRVSHAGKTADFVICFECYQTQVTVNGKREPTFLVSRSPTGAFNSALKKAGVLLPKQPE
jgi:hypothetical protein